MKKFEKRIVSVGSAGLAILAIGGCSSKQPEIPAGTIDNTDIANLPITTISLGESSYVDSISQDSPEATKIIAGVGFVDHIYPAKNGIEGDSHTPQITKMPTRFKAQVTLSGERSNYLDNDKGCDSFKIPESATKIAAFALGGKPNSTTISWPTLANGEPAKHFDVCYLQESEPEEGIVLYYE